MTFPYAAQATEHQKLEWLGGGTMQVLLDGRHTGGRLAMFRSSSPTGAASPVHVHDHEDEIFVMLSGSGVFWAGERRYEVGEGGVAFLPRGVPHAYHITSDAEILALATPAGLENFFRDAGWDLRHPKPEGWSITPASMGQAAVANGQTILGRPLAADGMIEAAHLSAGSGTASPAYMAGADDHEKLGWIAGGVLQILLDGQHTGGQLAMFRSSASAGAASPLYVHTLEDEITVMLSGSGIFWVGENRYEVGAGGVVFVPRGAPMAYRITADAEMLALATPAGLEAFFRQAGWDLRAPKPEGWEVSFDELAKASTATGQTVLGPPPNDHDLTSLDNSA